MSLTRIMSARYLDSSNTSNETLEHPALNLYLTFLKGRALHNVYPLRLKFSLKNFSYNIRMQYLEKSEEN